MNTRINDRFEPTQAVESIPAVLSRLGREASQLIVQETALIRAELEDKFWEARRSAIGLAAGALAMSCGFLLMLFAAGSALALVMPVWQALLVLGAPLAVLGMIVVGISQRKFEPRALAPKESLAVLRKDGAFLKEQVTG